MTLVELGALLGAMVATGGAINALERTPNNAEWAVNVFILVLIVVFVPVFGALWGAGIAALIHLFV